MATLFFARRQVINEVYLSSYSHDVVGPFLEFASIKPVADPDFQIRGSWSPKRYFSALGASVWSKNKGSLPPPLDRSATENTRRGKRAIIIIINEFKVGNRENQV